MNTATIFFLFVVIFTAQGVTLRVAPQPDQATCEGMAAAASDALTGQKIDVPDPDNAGGTKSALILDAKGFCNIATKSEHA